MIDANEAATATVMHFAAYDRIEPSRPLPELPLTSTQSCSRVSAAIKLAVIVPVLVAMTGAFAVLVAHAAEEPIIRASLLDRPVAILQLSLGLLVWLVLFAWPAHHLVGRLFSHRAVRIDTEAAHVVERTLTGTRAWRIPLSRFEGLTHHVRSSLSGVRHELVLVHPQRARSVLVAVADRIDRQEVEAMARALGVMEVPAGALYAASQRAPNTIAVATGQLRPAAT